MDVKVCDKESLSNTGGGNGNGPGNTGGNTSGHNATTNSPDVANQMNDAHPLDFEKPETESMNQQVMDLEEPQCHYLSQAEYEKVVKGARLTDPVEEPISRSCTDWICSVTLLGDKPVYMCAQQIHTVDDNYKESVLVDCNNHFTQTESSEAHLTLSVSVM